MVLGSAGRLALTRAVHSVPGAARAMATGNAKAGMEAMERVARKERSSDAAAMVWGVKRAVRDTGFDLGSFPAMRKGIVLEEAMRFAPFGAAGVFGILLFVRPFQEFILKTVGLGPKEEEA